MVKNTKQIALIQHRRGKLSELPRQLNEGEFGLALDTNELFIGNSTNPALAERIESNTFPYGNIQILTEFTDNLQKIIYRYKSNTDIKAHLPIVAKGNVLNPIVPLNSSIKVNGIEISFNNSSETTLSGIIKKINSTLGPTVKSFNDGTSCLSFITTDASLTLEDGVVPYGSTSIIGGLGFGEGSFTAVSSLPPERTLQEVLDDTVTAKSFGALGDASTTEDGNTLFNAIVSLNKAGVDSKYYRTLFIPSGTYLSNSVIPLPYGTHLKGEGIQRTIIKAANLSVPFFTSMDDNMNLAGTDEYGYNTNSAKYVTVEDMTIDVSESSVPTILVLTACNNIVFKNVEFIGNANTTAVEIKESSYKYNSLHILFEDCSFINGNYGIKTTSNLEHLVVKNCIFENIVNSSIDLEPLADRQVFNSIIEGNYFRNCGEGSPIIMLGERTSYVSTINNRFDIENSLFAVAKSYQTDSDTNYTDILDPHTDTKKLLQFNFTQPKWAYVDYLTNPNGEYLLQSHYNIEKIDGVDVIKPLTNGLILEQGDESNNNTFSIDSTSTLGNIHIASGDYGYIELGNEDKNLFEDWKKENTYIEGKKVQIQNSDDSYEIYECIKRITSEDIRRSNVEPYDGSVYWKYLGHYNPVIITNKPIDLNKNYITDTATDSNITFKTSHNNFLIVDDSSNNSDYKYSERIATESNAIPNVDYVNTIAQTTIRKKFDYETIQENGKNKQEIAYFDPNIYGGYINMNFLSVNIRRPFYPVIGALSNALEWKSKLRYYAGDVVKALSDDITQSAYEMFILERNEETHELDWYQYTDEVFTPEDDDLDGYGKPKPDYKAGLEDIYAVTYDSNERNLFYKINNEWYEVGGSDWKDLYPSYVDLPLDKTSGTYTRNSVIRLEANRKEYIITLTSEPSLEGFMTDIQNALEADSGILITLDDEKLRIAQEGWDKGQLILGNVQNDALGQLGFTMNPDDTVEVNTAELLKTYNSTDTLNPQDYIIKSVWIKSVGVSKNYVCAYDNIASSTFNQDLGTDGSISKWIEIDETDINGNPLKDVKYLSILAQADDTVDDETGEIVENEQRLLFMKDVIEADRRDFHSIYQRPFENNKEYHKKDRCLYAGRYWECLKDNTSESPYDLHNPELWLAVPEEGFNYHFDFERDTYLLDENDDITIADDVVLDYDFSDYHFFLMFYDKDQKRLVPFATDYNISNYTYKGVKATKAELDEIVGQVYDCYKVTETNKYYFWSIDNLWEEIEPTTNLCVSPAGNVTVTLNYLRGQGNIDYEDDSDSIIVTDASGYVIGKILNNNKQIVINEIGNILNSNDTVIGKKGNEQRLAYEVFDTSDETVTPAVIGYVDDYNIALDFDGNELGHIDEENATNIINDNGDIIGIVGDMAPMAYNKNNQIFGYVDENNDVYGYITVDNNKVIGKVGIVDMVGIIIGYVDKYNTIYDKNGNVIGKLKG